MHEEAFQLKRLPNGEVEFRRPGGRLLPAAPLAPVLPDFDPAEAIAQQLRDGGIVVDPYTGTPIWDGMPCDLGMAVEWFLAVTSRDSPPPPA